MAEAWLDRQPCQFRDRFMALCRPRTYRRGSSLAHMGDELEQFVGILEGCAEIHWEGFGKQSYHVRLFWPGDWIGDDALITGRPLKIAAKARTEVTAAVIPAHALSKMLEDYPAGWRSIADLATEHHELATNNLVARLHHGKDARCAAVLLSLVPGSGARRETADNLLIPINQDELAQLASLSRNSVGAALKHLRDLGLVDPQYGNIRICSIAALSAHLDRLISRSE